MRDFKSDHTMSLMSKLEYERAKERELLWTLAKYLGAVLARQWGCVMKPRMLCLDCRWSGPLPDPCTCPKCGSVALFNASLIQQFGYLNPKPCKQINPQRLAQ